MRGFKVGLATVVAAVGMFVGGTGIASADESQALLRFDSMTTVTHAGTNVLNDRNIVGGGKPWAITSGTGELDRNGMLHVSVTGLVIPVPPFNGTNPLGSFGAIVSCFTKQHALDNVFVGTFPTNPAGNATIDAQVALPRPCTQPVVFVTSPTGAWFARSNRSDDEGDDQGA